MDGVLRGTVAVDAHLEHFQAAIADRYRIERELGRGGMAIVYLARDRKHDRLVAIKVLNPSLSAAIGEERFRREIGIAAALQHPHLVPLFDSGRAADCLFYVMAYVEGGSLRDRLERGGPLSAREAAHLARDVALGLHHAHRHGIIHRDVKPENILLSGATAAVADFGIARPQAAPGMATGGTILGTPSYMSPEQASGEPDLDGRSDVYALGCVLYEMVAGAPPFAGPPHRVIANHIAAPIPALPDRAPLAAGLGRVIRRALEKDPADRFQTAEAFAEALDALLEAPWPPPRRLLTRGRAVAVALAAIAIVALALRGPSPSARSSEFDADVLAVAPFDVLDPTLAIWHEGLADVLSAALDGAGPLRTVPPSVVISRWKGPADAGSMRALGRSVRARFGVYGRLWASGPDSVRLMARLVDLRNDRTLADLELRNHRDAIDRLADSLAGHVLARLTTVTDLGAARLQSLGSSSPRAIRAFLAGEGFLRTTNWDSAEAYYREAVALDSTFALAYKRLGEVLGWFFGRAGRPEAVFRAASLNRGLAPRESLLITIDSLDVALITTGGYAARLALIDRLLATGHAATTRYPMDPGAWFRYGDLQWHYGPFLALPEEGAIEAMARAVSLDSSYTPAYTHLVEWELRHGPPGRATEAYLARARGGARADAVRLAAAAAREPSSAPTPEELATLDPQVVAQLGGIARRGLGLAPVAIAGQRARIARAAPGSRRWPNSGLAWILAYRGRLEEALAIGARESPTLFAELAMLGAIPADQAAAEFASWLTARLEGGNSGYHALPWWLAQGDSTSIAMSIAADSALLASGDSTRLEAARFRTEVATAYLALLRGDTTTALQHLEPLRRWPAFGAGHERLIQARVLSAIGRTEQAAELLRASFEGPDGPPRPLEILWQLERVKVDRQLGITSRATRELELVQGLWRDADPPLKRLIRETVGN